MEAFFSALEMAELTKMVVAADSEDGMAMEHLPVWKHLVAPEAPFLAFFLSSVSNTQLNHWTKWTVRTQLTSQPLNTVPSCSGSGSE